MDVIRSFLDFFYERGYVPNGPTNNSFDGSAFTSGADILIRTLLNSLTHMKLVSTIHGISVLYTMVQVVSYSFFGFIVAYQGAKLVLSMDNIDKIEGRKIINRIILSVIFGLLSMKVVDIIIMLVNVLIKFLISWFTLAPLVPQTGESFGLVVSILIMLVQVVISLKILVDFWIRMSEIVFSVVIGPAMFTLWINQDWSGYLRNWWKRINILIFTQLVQVVILIIYSLMVNGWLLEGSLDGICLSIATLVFLERSPVALAGLSDGSNFNKAKGTFKKLLNSKMVKTLIKR